MQQRKQEKTCKLSVKLSFNMLFCIDMLLHQSVQCDIQNMFYRQITVIYNKFTIWCLAQRQRQHLRTYEFNEQICKGLAFNGYQLS